MKIMTLLFALVCLFLSGCLTTQDVTPPNEVPDYSDIVIARF